jgi:NAD(P)-dependent dehydrogenase (short-subunit alcohol dehydrogenase family)
MEQGKISAVIVGAAGGIGQELCALIAQSGGEAYLVGRTAARLAPLAQQYGWGYSGADAADWEQLDAAISAAQGTLGGIQSAVCLAGSLLLKPAHLTSRSDLEQTMQANLVTAFGLVRACAPRMVAEGGSIVLMSSSAGRIGLSNHEAIAMCKAGVEGLVRSAAATYAGRGVRVNAIAPGLVQTPLTEKIWSNPRSAEASRSMHALGRLGEPGDIARAIFWLMSPAQSWVTGQTLAVDGGLGSIKLLAGPAKT